MLVLALYQFFDTTFHIPSSASGLDRDRFFVIFSTVAFQAEIENPMDNHTSAYHLWQAFFSHSRSSVG